MVVTELIFILPLFNRKLFVQCTSCQIWLLTLSMLK